MIIDLGCGKNKYKGAIGVDNVKLEGVDVVHDLLDFPYPFQTASADKIIISHTLEHFVLEDIIKIFNEMERILKEGGSVIVSVPHVFSPSTFGDPGHKSFFVYETLFCFTKTQPASYRKDLRLNHNWKITRIWTTVNAFSDRFAPPSRLNKILSKVFSRILNYILKNSRSMTLPDLIAKYLPVWLINIHVQFQKISNGE